jgi:hypothetical protein
MLCCSMKELQTEYTYRLCDESKYSWKMKAWWLGVGGTAPNSRWTLCLDLKEGLAPLVNGFGRRWVSGRQVLAIEQNREVVV